MKISYIEEMVNTFPPGFEGWRLYRVEFSNGRSGAIWCSPELGRPIDASVTLKQDNRNQFPFFAFPKDTFQLTDD